jgi:hypothetical protein
VILTAKTGLKGDQLQAVKDAICLLHSFIADGNKIEVASQILI